jgi:hypothetical protein
MARPQKPIVVARVFATLADDPRAPSPGISLQMRIAQGPQSVAGRDAFVLLRPADLDLALSTSPDVVRLLRAALQRHDASVAARSAPPASR